MSQLHDGHRLRALRRACQRTGEVRKHPWWVWRRRTAEETAANPYSVNHVYRLALSGLIICGGFLLWKNPLAGQVLTLAALVLLQARIQRLQALLGSDRSLILLGQLPISDREILAYQLRNRWRDHGFYLLESAGFWAVAWSMLGTIPWLWLPLIAVTHALLMEALTLLLLRSWRHSGCLLYALVGGVIWGIVNQDKYPVLLSVLDPLLHLLGWATPWGWLNLLATHLPRNPWLGCSSIMLALAALVTLRWAQRRLTDTWTLDHLYRDSVGRPLHTWEDVDDHDLDHTSDAAAESSRPLATTDGSIAASGQAATPDTDAAANAIRTLATIRARQDGGSLLAFGLSGRAVLHRCDADDRWLVDLLAPAGTGPLQWRWAMVFAGVPALCALLDQPLHWSLTVLATILLLRRMVRRGLLLGALMIAALLVPNLTPVLGAGLPCAVAVLMAIPLAGGMWGGLPMGATVLGTVPRTWWRLMRLMLLLTGLRLAASVPLIALVLIAIGMGLDAIPAALIAAGWLIVVLSTPWLSALYLLQRTPGGIDINLGRTALTFGSALCILLHATSAVLLLIGCCQPVVTGGLEPAGAMLIAGGIGLSLITSAAHIALLRRAYRRAVDLVPPV